MLYFIIEHPTRGVLQTETTDEGNPSFSWSKPRTHEDNARYYTLRRAIQDWSELSIPTDCVIRSSEDDGTYNGAWPVVWPLEES